MELRIRGRHADFGFVTAYRCRRDRKGPGGHGLCSPCYGTYRAGVCTGSYPFTDMAEGKHACEPAASHRYAGATASCLVRDTGLLSGLSDAAFVWGVLSRWDFGGDHLVSRLCHSSNGVWYGPDYGADI